MSFAISYAAWAFWQTKRRARRFRTRADIDGWQTARLDRFVRHTIRGVPFFRGAGFERLDDLPILDKSVVLANFENLNVAGVSLREARAALDNGTGIARGLMVGQSTGTSGNRGVFVISEAERFTWLGVILAKALPDFPFKRHRVALALPGYSHLYASAAETGRLAIRFFDLGLGVDRWLDDLRRYAPDTIVAPPKVLRALAERGGCSFENVFSGAEVLDPIDRGIIESGFGTRVREIYMATEGLFGVGCPSGTLHLAEDVVAFEWEPSAGSSQLVSPIVTDFTRSAQIMARYRMNDLLRLSPSPCPCGSPLQAVTSVEGRRDDVFHLLSRSGDGIVLVTPDVVRNAVVDADRRILDFRIVQTGAATIELSLDAGLSEETFAAAVASLNASLAKIGAGLLEIRVKVGLDVSMDRKLRRVRRDWQSPG